MPGEEIINTNTDIQYFKSGDIKVFPCSFRGNYVIETGTYAGQSYTFDPESRLTTEYNFTHLHSVGDFNSSYVIYYDSESNILYCVIGGYYFEISHIDPTQLYGKTLAIKVREIELKEDTVDSTTGATSIDSNRITKVLESWETGSTQSLDGKLEGSSDYKFFGLAITNGNVPCDASLSDIFEESGALNNNSLKPILYHGKGEKSIRIGDKTEATGNYSIAQGYGTKATGECAHAEGHATKAAGKNAHAEGSYVDDKSPDTPLSDYGAVGPASHTEGYNTLVANTAIAGHAEGARTAVMSKQGHAEGYGTRVTKPVTDDENSGIAAHAEGYKTITKNKAAHAEGIETEASGEASHAGGSHTIASRANQTVIGKYNVEEDGEFIVGIGTDEERKNALVVNSSTTTIKNKLVVNNNSSTNKDTFVTDPDKTEIKTETTDISGSTISIKDNTNGSTKIGLEKENIILQDTADSTIKINRNSTAKQIELSSTNINSIARSTNSLLGKAINLTASELIIAKIGSDQNKLSIGGTATSLTNSALVLNGASSIELQANTNTKLKLTSNDLTLSHDLITLNSGEKQIKLDSTGTAITGDISIIGDEIITGTVKFGANDGSDGKISYRANNTEFPVITTKFFDTVNVKDACGAILGNNGTTIIKGGHKLALPASSQDPETYNWTSEDVIINAGLDTYIIGNTSNESDKKTWLFKHDGFSFFPNTLFVECSDNEDTQILGATTLDHSNNFYTINNLSNNRGIEHKINNKPISIIQYYDNSKQGEAVLLDKDGNTSFSGQVSCSSLATLNASGAGINIKNGNEINFSSNDTSIHFGYTKYGQNKITTYYFHTSKDTESDPASYGEVVAESFNAMSDMRLKENIKPYTIKNSILDLPIYKYDFIAGNKNQIGCIAQDLQKICPEIVEEGSDGYLSIKESKIVYLLLEEVKKLKKEIDLMKEANSYGR